MYPYKEQLVREVKFKENGWTLRLGFHLDFRACAMDWRVKSAGSREERVSWVAGRVRSCISLVLVVVKNSHFTATRWAQKITAV